MTDTQEGIQLHLHAAVSDGDAKVVLTCAWDNQPLTAEYSGGPYIEVLIGAYREVIHADQEDTIRSLWSNEPGTDLRLALLFTRIDKWCRTQDEENPGWWGQYEGYGQWLQ